MTISISRWLIPGGTVTTVRFAYDESIIVAIRREFPSARWDALRKYWTVPGKTSFERASKFFAREFPTTLVIENGGSSGVGYFIGGEPVKK
jgi:hypothetical protein